MNNFFNKKISQKKYIKILNIHGFSRKKEFVLKNPGLFLGDKSLFRIFTNYKLILEQKKIPGDIIEFGIWNGNNLLLIKKICDFFKIKKIIWGYDHFKGLINPEKKDKFFTKKNLIIFQ